MDVEVLTRKAPGVWRGEAWLLKAQDGRMFVASGVDALYSGWEVLVFPVLSASEGDIEVDYVEVVGGRGITHQEAVEELSKWLDYKEEAVNG
jgi:hypothetical protein